jgi:hypothetical protein
MRFHELMPSTNELVMEGPQYEDMFTDLRQFAKLYSHFARGTELKEEWISVEIKIARERFKRSDIITFILLYIRLSMACANFRHILHHYQESILRLDDEAIKEYILGIAGLDLKKYPNDVASAIMELRSATEYATQILKKYLKVLLNRGETIQSLSELGVLSDFAAQLINSPQASSSYFNISRMASTSRGIYGDMIHYIDMKQAFPAILDNINFDNRPFSAVVGELSSREQALKQQIQGIPESQLTDNFSLLLRFSDGFAWFNLNTPVSKDEAKMMGHCCRDPRIGTSGTVYSLRKVTRKSGVTYHDSHVTVMVKDKATYEIKGRVNAKPIPKYHKYLVALLQSPLIDHMVDGGYMAENNFKITDLDPDQAKELIEKKPSFVTLKILEHIYGEESSEIEDYISDTVSMLEENRIVKRDNDGNYLILEKEYVLNDIIWMFGNEKARAERKRYIYEDGLYRPYSINKNMKYFYDFFDDDECRSAILRFIKENHSYELKQYYIENSVSDEEDINWETLILMPEFERIAGIVNYSINESRAAVAYRDLERAFESEIDDFISSPAKGLGSFIFDEDVVYPMSISPVSQSDLGTTWYKDSNFYIKISEESLRSMLWNYDVDEALADMKLSGYYAIFQLHDTVSDTDSDSSPIRIIEGELGWGDGEYDFEEAKEMFLHSVKFG